MDAKREELRKKLAIKLIEAIKQFAREEGGLCLSDIESILGHNARLMTALFEKMKVSF